jgi:hypothetical protein
MNAITPERFTSMLRFKLFAIFMSIGWFTAAAGWADELEAFKVMAVTGANAGSEVEYLSQRKDKTTVYLFLQGEHWGRPIARYVKVLDTKIVDGIKGEVDVQAVAVWLSDDAAKGKEYLPRAQMSLNLSRTDWSVFEGQKAGPDGWNVDIADSLTSVIIRDGKEIARFKYKSTNDTDVPDVIKALEK